MTLYDGYPLAHALSQVVCLILFVKNAVHLAMFKSCAYQLIDHCLIMIRLLEIRTCGREGLEMVVQNHANSCSIWFCDFWWTSELVRRGETYTALTQNKLSFPYHYPSSRHNCWFPSCLVWKLFNLTNRLQCMTHLWLTLI